MGSMRYAPLHGGLTFEKASVSCPGTHAFASSVQQEVNQACPRNTLSTGSSEPTTQSAPAFFSTFAFRSLRA